MWYKDFQILVRKKKLPISGNVLWKFVRPLLSVSRLNRHTCHCGAPVSQLPFKAMVS